MLSGRLRSSNHGPDAEQLVQGRERIYFGRIWNDFTGDPSKPDDATRDFFTATYAQPGGMRVSFAQFSAFSQDAKDNKIFEETKLLMPVLAVGGEKSFGPHANSRITLDVCMQAVNSNKRAAQSKVVRMIVSNVGQQIEEKYPQTRQ